MVGGNPDDDTGSNRLSQPRFTGYMTSGRSPVGSRHATIVFKKSQVNTTAPFKDSEPDQKSKTYTENANNQVMSPQIVEEPDFTRDTYMTPAKNEGKVISIDQVEDSSPENNIPGEVTPYSDIPASVVTPSNEKPIVASPGTRPRVISQSYVRDQRMQRVNQNSPMKNDKDSQKRVIRGTQNVIQGTQRKDEIKNVYGIVSENRVANKRGSQVSPKEERPMIKVKSRPQSATTNGSKTSDRISKGSVTNNSAQNIRKKQVQSSESNKYSYMTNQYSRTLQEAKQTGFQVTPNRRFAVVQSVNTVGGTGSNKPNGGQYSTVQTSFLDRKKKSVPIIRGSQVGAGNLSKTLNKNYKNNYITVGVNRPSVTPAKVEMESNDPNKKVSFTGLKKTQVSAYRDRISQVQKQPKPQRIALSKTKMVEEPKKEQGAVEKVNEAFQDLQKRIKAIQTRQTPTAKVNNTSMNSVTPMKKKIRTKTAVNQSMMVHSPAKSFQDTKFQDSVGRNSVLQNKAPMTPSAMSLNDKNKSMVQMGDHDDELSEQPPEDFESEDLSEEEKKVKNFDDIKIQSKSPEPKKQIKNEAKVEEKDISPPKTAIKITGIDVENVDEPKEKKKKSIEEPKVENLDQEAQPNPEELKKQEAEKELDDFEKLEDQISAFEEQVQESQLQRYRTSIRDTEKMMKRVQGLMRQKTLFKNLKISIGELPDARKSASKEEETKHTFEFKELDFDSQAVKTLKTPKIKIMNLTCGFEVKEEQMNHIVSFKNVDL